MKDKKLLKKLKQANTNLSINIIGGYLIYKELLNNSTFTFADYLELVEIHINENEFDVRKILDDLKN